MHPSAAARFFSGHKSDSLSSKNPEASKHNSAIQANTHFTSHHFGSSLREETLPTLDICLPSHQVSHRGSFDNSIPMEYSASTATTWSIFTNPKQNGEKLLPEAIPSDHPSRDNGHEKQHFSACHLTADTMSLAKCSSSGATPMSVAEEGISPKDINGVKTAACTSTDLCSMPTVTDKRSSRNMYGNVTVSNIGAEEDELETTSIEHVEHVRVIVRVRPRRFSTKGPNPWCIHTESGVIEHTTTASSDFQNRGGSRNANPSAGSAKMHFTFDTILDENAQQEDVMACVSEPTLEKVLEGYNGTVLCYGQSGSGKTHTMIGPDGGKAEGMRNPQNGGLLPRFLAALFDKLREKYSNVAEANPKSETSEEKVSMGRATPFGAPPQGSLNSGARQTHFNHTNAHVSSDTNSARPSEQYLSLQERVDWRWIVEIGAIELYREDLRDLLADVNLHDPSTLSTFPTRFSSANSPSLSPMKPTLEAPQCSMEVDAKLVHTPRGTNRTEELTAPQTQSPSVRSSSLLRSPGASLMRGNLSGIRRATSTQSSPSVTAIQTTRNQFGGMRGNSVTLKICEDAQWGIVVEGLTRHSVSSAAEATRVVSAALRQRHMGTTALNEHSSRSHALFFVSLQQWDGEEAMLEDVPEGELPRDGWTRSVLTLVDLAGSERVAATGAEGLRLKEAQRINLSLTLLGNVIRKLAKPRRTGQEHIPYRDSKLTRLLQESIGGNAHTTLLCNISTDSCDVMESFSTLRFARLAKHIRNRPVVNRVFTTAEMKAQLTAAHERIALLERQLLEQRESITRQLGVGAELTDGDTERAEEEDDDDDDEMEEEEVVNAVMALPHPQGEPDEDKPHLKVIPIQAILKEREARKRGTAQASPSMSSLKRHVREHPDALGNHSTLAEVERLREELRLVRADLTQSRAAHASALAALHLESTRHQQLKQHHDNDNTERGKEEVHDLVELTSPIHVYTSAPRTEMESSDFFALPKRTPATEGNAAESPSLTMHTKRVVKRRGTPSHSARGKNPYYEALVRLLRAISPSWGASPSAVHVSHVHMQDILVVRAETSIKESTTNGTNGAEREVCGESGGSTSRSVRSTAGVRVEEQKRLVAMLMLYGVSDMM